MLKLHDTNRLLIIDIERDRIVKEISAINQLVDPERYVFSGCETDIRANNDSSYYLTFPTEQDSNEPQNALRNSLYRSFCEVDLQEVKRIQQSIRQQKKFK